MARYLLILSCLILGASSCISSKKFSDMEVLKEYYKLKADTLRLVQKENTVLKNSLSKTKAQLTQTSTDLAATKANLGQLQSQFDQLSAGYKQLESSNQKLSVSSKNETQSLKSELDKATSENDRMKAILVTLDRAYQYNMNGAVLANDTWSQQLQRMQNVSETIDAEKAQLQTLFQLLANLPDFQKDGLEVLMYGGKLVVRLGADEIFRSGSSQINTLGRNVIRDITGVILRNSNLDVHVEGHSDAQGSDSSNWTTSSQRATSVAKEMITNDFMPTRLFATGMSSHHPVNPEDTKEARKLNRRVEIVIGPRASLR